MAKQIHPTKPMVKSDSDPLKPIQQESTTVSYDDRNDEVATDETASTKSYQTEN